MTSHAPAREHAEVVDMRELAPYASASRLQAVRAEEDGVVLTWDDGLSGFFHYLWLRDHCACGECRHPQTRERLVRIIDLPESLPAPDEAELDADGALRVAWPATAECAAHASRFDPGWLRQRADGDAPDPLAVNRKIPWDAGVADSLPVVEYEAFMETEAGLAAWLRALDRFGFAILRAGPVEEGQILRVAERVGWPRETNFGRYFDVVSKPDPNNAAYTTIALDPHVDLPNWERPPDFQLLYCLTNDAQGGDSVFTDGYAVAEALRDADAEAFRILNELAIDFRFQDENSDISFRAPVIDSDEHGNPSIIRFNNWIRDTLRLPREQVGPFYRAYRRFWDLLCDSRYTLRFKLRPGEMIAFDNLRVLHGREAFQPDTGRRHLQGIYLDRDLVRSRQRVLERSRSGVTGR